MDDRFRPDPALWPLQPAAERDPAIEARVQALLATMSLEEKVGQVIQADMASATPEDVRTYHLGAMLNGGNSAPGGNNRARPAEWLETVDAFFRASVDTSGGRTGVPLLWGTDAVHGHNKVVGATIFPHNIGLGAARDRDLVRRIAAVTAAEVRVTGMDWTFAPTLAVARDDRWGRTYESFSEDPALVSSYAGAVVEGLQGTPGTDEFMSREKVLATAKHFAGDGGTENGVDQGDSLIDAETMRDLHTAGYPPAIAAGVQVVMASFNAWHGRKLHGMKEMLSDVLTGRLGFDGFVVGDWNGHGQVEGCTNTSAAPAFNAGLDMFMAPDSWKELWANTLEDVREGRIPMDRLDEAVGRILRVKRRMGLFDAAAPADRHLAGEFSLLGCEEHRAIAREAVRKSLVLLKNDGVLPVYPHSRILVCGPGADNLAMQCGGWTVSWQGSGFVREDFPEAQTVYEALRAAADGPVELSPDGTWAEKPDVAFVVFGEEPYAEFQGDLETVDFSSDEPLELMRSLKAAGIKVVSVFLSGRPLWVNPELNSSDAFIAAFLPGTEAGGLADLVLADSEGRPGYDFTGRLSFSWPRAPLQPPQNEGDDDYDPLFPYGYGLSLTDRTASVLHDENCRLATRGGDNITDLFIAGKPRGRWSLHLEGDFGAIPVDATSVASPDGVIRAEVRDHLAQEDTRLVSWDGAARVAVCGPAANFTREVNAQMAVLIDCRLAGAAWADVWLSMRDENGGEAELQINWMLDRFEHGEWGTMVFPLVWFDRQKVDISRLVSPISIRTDNKLALQIRDIRIAAWEEKEA